MKKTNGYQAGSYVYRHVDGLYEKAQGDLCFTSGEWQSIGLPEFIEMRRWACYTFKSLKGASREGIERTLWYGLPKGVGIEVIEVEPEFPIPSVLMPRETAFGRPAIPEWVLKALPEFCESHLTPGSQEGIVVLKAKSTGRFLLWRYNRPCHATYIRSERDVVEYHHYPLAGGQTLIVEGGTSCRGK